MISKVGQLQLASRQCQAAADASSDPSLKRQLANQALKYAEEAEALDRSFQKK